MGDWVVQGVRLVVSRNSKNQRKRRSKIAASGKEAIAFKESQSRDAVKVFNLQVETGFLFLIKAPTRPVTPSGSRFNQFNRTGRAGV